MQPIDEALGLPHSMQPGEETSPWGEGASSCALIASLPLQGHPVSCVEQILWTKCT